MDLLTFVCRFENKFVDIKDPADYSESELLDSELDLVGGGEFVGGGG